MSVTFLDLEQRSPAWFQARCGRLTGSVAKHVLAERKRGSGELGDRIKLRARLVAERLTGQSHDEDAFVSNEMRRGIRLESQALLAYEAAYGVIVRPTGFIRHDTLMVGCSLDGYIGADVQGIVEVKCPNSDTHLGYWQTGGPDEYDAQAAHNLWVSGGHWCDFVSYDDRYLDPAMQLLCVRRTRADVDVDTYARKAIAFLDEVDRDEQVMRTRSNPRAVFQQIVGARLAVAR